MNIAIIIIGTVTAIVGISVATWSIIDTRKRYNEKHRKGKHRVED